MLLPKKVKFRKWHSMRHNPNKPKTESRGTTVAFGSFGLKADGPGRIHANQIEAARKAISRNLEKTGKLWIRIFPDKPFTMKGAGLSMGKGKGEPKGYEAIIWPGRVIFEVEGVKESVAKEAMRKAGSKLPLKTKFVARV